MVAQTRVEIAGFEDSGACRLAAGWKHNMREMRSSMSWFPARVLRRTRSHLLREACS